MDAELHRRCANTIKGLAMDAVQAADSGHPGMPMGMADAATVLFTRFVRFDPTRPDWFDRDRFILSAGHGSMLLYSVLHLAGYDLSIDDLKAFRQWGSKTPGHPEVGHTPGVETTTGPLGQGVANMVGFAMAERLLRETFGPELCDHMTYGIAGDGCLMEGVAYEAASLAGHLGLGRLILLWDDNHITIDGATDISTSEDIPARMEAMGWHVQRVDGHDPEAVAMAIEAAKAVDDKPSLVCCRTIIGQGSPSFQGTSRTHGSPLGAAEVRLTKERLGMDPDASFVVPADVAAAFRGAARADLREAWEARLAGHEKAATFRSWLQHDAEGLIARAAWPDFQPGKSVATRVASQDCLKALWGDAHWLIGGSADLAGSNGTKVGGPAISKQRFAGASTIHFGVREHAMGAICNGMMLHGGVRPYCATFLVFHDYQRPAVRLSALMKQPVIYIYTHDSVFLGEDGPTHQPVASLLALRSLPNIHVVRPADATETVEAWKLALRSTDRPTALVLSRQNLPNLDRSRYAHAYGVQRGGYVLSDVEQPKVILIGTGSEVALCLEAQTLLAAEGVAARVVSMPCRELFLAQEAEYRDGVLLAGVPRVSVEAAVTMGWREVVGDSGVMIGIDTFGHSAPAEVIAEKLGFTPRAVADVARAAAR
jgi:transketolase